MINVVDRVPTQAGRWKITHADSSVEYVTMERADEPSVEGTPINKVLFDSINTDIEHKKYVIGTYTGNNSDDRATQDINLNFTPSAVIVVKGLVQGGTGSTGYSTLCGMAITDSDFIYISGLGVTRTLISIIENGFKVSNYDTYARFNENGTIYKYIAFE